MTIIIPVVVPGRSSTVQPHFFSFCTGTQFLYRTKTEIIIVSTNIKVNSEDGTFSVIDCSVRGTIIVVCAVYLLRVTSHFRKRGGGGSQRGESHKLWGERRVTVVKGWLRKANSRSYKNVVSFPMNLQKWKTHTLTVEVSRRIINSCHKRNIMRGTIIIVDTVMEYFVRGFLIFAFYCPTKSVG